MNAQIAITSIIALLLGWIAYQQWKTNRDRLRHELFEKRIAVYDTIADFLATIGRRGKVEKGADLRFLFDTRRAYFVFGCDEEIKKLVSDIFKHAVNLECCGTELEAVSGKERSELVKKARFEKDWISETLSSLEDRFEKYLKLAH